MARIRTIKPEFWSSPDVHRASPIARLTYIALWTWVDDQGVGTMNEKEVEGYIFPLDDLPTLSEGSSENFRHVMKEVADCFEMAFYRVENRPYLKVINFDRHQRTERKAQGRHPGPESADEGLVTNDYSVFVGSSDNFRHTAKEVPARHEGSSVTGTGEQGNRGTGEQGNSNPPTPQRGKEVDPYPAANKLPKENGRYEHPPEFDTFYAAYPHARDAGNKIGSYRSWRTAVKSGTSPSDIQAGAERYADDPNRVDQFTKACTTWLNKQGWLDGPLPARTDNDRGLAAAAREMTRYQQTAGTSHLQIADDPYPWETEQKEIGS